MKRARLMNGLLMTALALGTPACSSAQTPPPAEPASPAPAAQSDANATRARAAEVRAKVAAGKGANFWYARTGGKKEKATYLGVVMVQADPALRDQLKMPRGIGLIVQSVEDNTPAAKAGLQAHDLITKLDDQWLVDSQQFGVLVRMHKVDDEVTLTGLRHGEPVTIKAKLGEKEMVVSDAGEQAEGDWGVSGLTLDTNGLQSLQSLNGIKGWVTDDDAPLVIHQNDETLTVTLDNGERHLVAKDKDDNVTFDGAVETDDQRKALPANISDTLEKYKEQFDKVKEGGKQRIRIINSDR